MKTFDAIVVGARCAGSVVATFLARAGLEVLLVDRMTFPSDVVSTHTLFNNTVATLRELGVMEQLLTSDTPAIGHMRAQFEDVVIKGPVPMYQGERYGYCFKRTLLDKVLFDNAKSQNGVTSMEGFRVTDLLFEDGVVVGMKGHDREGNEQAFHAKIVIGADGRNSTVRQLVGSEKKTALKGEIASYYAYFADVETLDDEVAFELYAKDEYRAYIFPTGDGHHVMVAGFPVHNKELVQKFKSEPEQTLRAFYEQHFPRAATRIADAHLVDGFKGMFNFENYWYQGMGRGWALVGDAICFKDPGVGQGMHDAIYGAQMLADLLAKNGDRLQEWEELAAEYQTMIENEFMARYEAACEVTIAAAVPAEQIEMFRAVAQNELATEKFLGFYNYTAEREDLVQVFQT